MFGCGVICRSGVIFEASDREGRSHHTRKLKSVVWFKDPLIIVRIYIIIVVPKITICNSHCLHLDPEK